MADLSLYAIKAVLILDNEGNRLFAKYYQPPHKNPHPSGGGEYVNELAAASAKDQKTFEKGLFSKTNKQNADVIIYDSNVVVYKQLVDIVIYVVADLDENECMVYQVVMGLKDALEILLKHSVDKRTLLENYDLVALAVDEAVDGGVILEIDPVIIASRVSRTPASDLPSLQNIDLSEQSLSGLMSFARGKIVDRLRQL